jgi:hypothetical protein
MGKITTLFTLIAVMLACIINQVQALTADE